MDDGGRVRQAWVQWREEIDPGFEDPQCHAATLVAQEGGLLLAFFGGPHGGTTDSGIWLTRRREKRWEEPTRVAAPRGSGMRCWNPVLHATAEGALLLFYKEGPNCADWRGLVMRSSDGGRTWGPPDGLPEGIWGPTRNKPLELDDGTLLCGSSTEQGPWCVHFERTPDAGHTWTRTPPLRGDEPFDAIQPTLLAWPGGAIQALCRSRAGVLLEATSRDEGRTWSPLRRTDLPNPNSAVDAVSLPDGRALLVYNPTTCPDGWWTGRRTPLSVAVSRDGRRWQRIGDLEDEPGEFSYPAVVLDGRGFVHVVYTTGMTWAGLKHVVLDPQAIDRRAG